MSYVDVKPGHVDEHNLVIDHALSRADQLLEDLGNLMKQADNATMNSGSNDWKALITQWNAFYTQEEAKLQSVGVGSYGAIEAIRQGDYGAGRAMGH
jgi:hypothetical protein